MFTRLITSTLPRTYLIMSAFRVTDFENKCKTLVQLNSTALIFERSLGPFRQAQVAQTPCIIIASYIIVQGNLSKCMENQNFFTIAPKCNKIVQPTLCSLVIFISMLILLWRFFEERFLRRSEKKYKVLLSLVAPQKVL